MPAHAYRLERLQFIPRTREEVFAFFVEASNLEALTPNFLRFRILTPRPIHMHPGTLIDYELQLFRLPLRWRTCIETFDPPQRFTDIQLTGPYQRWHHLHEFFEVSGGTLMLDQVDYALPLGILGKVAHACFVRRTLERIFDYRYQRLTGVFTIKSSRL